MENIDFTQSTSERYEATGALGKFETIAYTLQSIVKTLGAITRHWRDIQQSAFEASRAIGLNREQAMAYDRVLMQSTKALGRMYGVTYKDIAKWQQEYVERTGKAIIMNRRQQESMAAMSRLAGADTAAQMADEMNRFGASIDEAGIQVALIQERAKAMGLSTQAASATLAKNIHLASTYQFKNGIDGLQRMVLKSQALRVNMESITAASEKFQTIEGAIKSSAQLQMLGGSFAAQFSNPMGAMYEALNDEEAFMERLRKSVEGKATFDKKTGTARITGLDQQFLKAAAEAMGMDRKELTQMAMSNAKNAQVDAAISKIGFSVDNAQKALIQNKARWDTDQQKFVIDKLDRWGTKISELDVSSLTKDQLKELQDTNLTQENLWGDVQEIRDILRDTFGSRAKQTTSTNENIEGLKSEWDATLGQFENFLMGTIGSYALNGNNLPIWDQLKWVGTFPGAGTGAWGFGEVPQMGMANPFGYTWPNNPFGLGNGGTAGFMGFENGGIVDQTPIKAAMGAYIPGDSYSGDKVPVMANSGEMIINKEEQSALWETIKSLGKMAAYTVAGNYVGKKMGMGNIGTISAISAGGNWLGSQIGLNGLGTLAGIGLSAKNLGGNNSLLYRRMFGSNYMNSPMLGGGMMPRRPGMGGTVTMMNPMVNMMGNISMNGGMMGGYGMGLSPYDMMDFGGGGKNKTNVKAKGVKGGKYKALARLFGRDSSFRYRNVNNRFAKAEDLTAIQRWGQRLGFKPSTIANPMNAVKNSLNSSAKSIKASTGSITKNLTSFGSSGGKALSSVGKGLKGVTRGMGPIGTLIGVGMMSSEFSAANSKYDEQVRQIEGSNLSDLEKAKAKDQAVKAKNAEKGSSVGSLGGGLAGAAAGAAIGSVVPVVGTAIGGLIGGIVGSMGGGAIGETIGGWFGGDNEEKLKEEEEKRNEESGAFGSSNSKILTDIYTEVKGIHHRVGGNVASPSSPFGGVLDIIKPLTPIGMLSYVAPVAAKKFESPAPTKPQDINLNISGSIKLEGNNGSVPMDNLLNDPKFVSSLTNMIISQLSRLKNGGRDEKEKNVNEYRTPWSR